MRTFADLKESYDGDLIIEGGDFGDTSNSPSLGINQIIRTLVNTEPGEFLYFKDFGFDASSYEGSENTVQVGLNLAKSLKTAISENTYLYYSEIEVTPFPVSRTAIALKTNITTLGEMTDMTIVYDTNENKFGVVRPMPAMAESTVTVPIEPTANSRLR